MVGAQVQARQKGISAADAAQARAVVADGAKALEGQTLTARAAEGGDRSVTLGSRLGGGTYGQVFDAKGEPQKVVKLFGNPTIPEARVKEAVRGQLEGMRLLERAQPGELIATKRILGGETNPDAPVPFFVMDKLRGEERLRNELGSGARKLGDLGRDVEYQVDVAARRARGAQALAEEEQRAVADL
jgi:hypothetical protein